MKFICGQDCFKLHNNEFAHAFIFLAAKWMRVLKAGTFSSARVAIGILLDRHAIFLARRRRSIRRKMSKLDD